MSSEKRDKDDGAAVADSSKSSLSTMSTGSGGIQYPFFALIIGSILSSVALVVVNKIIFERGFPFVFCLSTFHFIVTAGLLSLMSNGLGLFKPGYLPRLTNIVVGGLGVASITLMNFSLQYNSVGFYQVAKLCVIPAVLIISFFVPNADEKASLKVKGSLILVLFGVGVATVTDVQFNVKGLIFGILAVLSTAQYQIWQGSKQKEAGLNGMQCAQSVAGVQVIYGALFTLVFEGEQLKALYDGERELLDATYVIGLIILSCFLAVSVNVHSFSMIGRSSAVTFQVVGHGKTILILISGYMMTPIEDESLFLKNLFGVTVAMLGVILYSHLKLAEKSPNDPDWCDRYLPLCILSLFLPSSSYSSEKPSALPL